MRNRFRSAIVTAGLFATMLPVAAQTAPYRAPRAADGHPNLNGIWQALNNANWDIQGHSASMGPVSALGAAYSVAPDIGVVEGNEIPYLPAALAKKKENFANRMTMDPEIKCYLPGVPRATYMPYPFQIFQTDKYILISYEFAGAVRTIYMNGKDTAPAPTWMGWSNGHWEGDTLVVDVTGQNDQTWFDRAGNFHGEDVHVVERYTPRSADTIMYEATITDPMTFSKPWKISMPLYRHVEKNAQLLEYKCVEFAEEVLYGHLRKKTDTKKK